MQKTGVSSRETLQKKYSEEVAPLGMQLEQQFQQFQMFGQEESRKAREIVMAKVDKVIESIQDAHEKNTHEEMVVLPSEFLLGKIPKKMDITDQILATLNKEYETKKKEEKKSTIAAAKAA